MNPDEFIAPTWQAVCEHNGLRTFQDWWTLEAGWFEEPNKRRGGWSGVSRCELKLPSGGIASIFLKRQENHVTRTLRHPLRGEATFACEFRNILRYQRLGIPALTPVYFSTQRVDGALRAILVTEDLRDFRSLEELRRHAAEKGFPPNTIWSEVIHAVAQQLRVLHGHGLRHHAFYPKHVFIRVRGAPAACEIRRPVEVRIIDLEKTAWSPWGSTLGDFSRLHGKAGTWRAKDKLRFLESYHETPALTPGVRKHWREIARRLERRGKL